MLVGKAFLITIIYVIAYQLFGLIFLVHIVIPTTPNTEAYYWLDSLLTFSYNVLFMVFIFWNFSKMGFFNIWMLNIKKIVRPTQLLCATLLGFIFVYLQTPLNYLYSYFPGTPKFEGFDSGLLELNLWNLPLLVSSIIVVPITQESFFRAFILKQLNNGYNHIVALVISSMLFGLIHLPNTNQTFIAIWGGLIAGIIYVKSDRIILPILFHISWNFTANFLLYFELPFIHFN